MKINFTIIDEFNTSLNFNIDVIKNKNDFIEKFKQEVFDQYATANIIASNHTIYVLANSYNIIFDLVFSNSLEKILFKKKKYIFKVSDVMRHIMLLDELPDLNFCKKYNGKMATKKLDKIWILCYDLTIILYEETGNE